MFILHLLQSVCRRLFYTEGPERGEPRTRGMMNSVTALHALRLLKRNHKGHKSTHTYMHTQSHAHWQTTQTPPACSFIYRLSSSSMLFHVCFPLHACLCVRASGRVSICFHERGGVWKMAAGVWVHFPCLRRNSDTGTLCWTFLSITRSSPPRRVTEGSREGAREGGVERWEEESEGPIKV